MIKINLAAERKHPKARSAPRAARPAGAEAAGIGQNVALIAILAVGVALAGIWWYSLRQDLADLRQQHEEADAELARLAEVRKQGETFKQQKDLLARKVDLITELKRRQEVPVHILDQVSRTLPDFLWLETMTAVQNQLSIAGKATNFNSVSNFYQNLVDSGYFEDVDLGKTFEVQEGVAFSVSCKFRPLGEVPASAGAEG